MTSKLLLARVSAALDSGDPDEALGRALDVVADAFAASTATLHAASPAARTLRMVASRGLPPHIAERTREIPFGKGMAGLAIERREIVTVCNLQTDESGVAKPAAKETGVAGAIVVPVLERGDAVGTLGIGKPSEHVYTDEERADLSACATALAPALARYRR